MSQTSLADFVIEAGHGSNTKPEIMKRPIAYIGRELVGNKKQGRLPVHRFIYDKEVDKVVTRLASEVPLQDFVEQFQHILMPFDSFWIEDVPPEPEKQFLSSTQRKGFLLRKEGEEIKVRYVMENILPDKKLKPKDYQVSKETIQGAGFYLRDDKYILAPEADISFSRRGLSVSYPEKSVLSHDELYDEKSNIEHRKANTLKDAEYIYCLLVLASSRNIKTNLISSPPAMNIIQPSSNLQSIRIDLSPQLEQALYNRDKKQVRELLGWTDVMRHRQTYHTKNGDVVKVIEPYERRIAAPIDRRGKNKRIFTANDSDLGIEFGPDRPRLISKKDKGKLNPTG